MLGATSHVGILGIEKIKAISKLLLSSHSNVSSRGWRRDKVGSGAGTRREKKLLGAFAGARRQAHGFKYNLEIYHW